MTTEDTLLTMLRSTDEEERLRGLKCLGSDPDVLSSALIYEALADDSWRVRKEAADLFLSLPWAGDLAGEIAELLHSQDNAGLRNAAVEILTRLGRSALPTCSMNWAAATMTCGNSRWIYLARLAILPVSQP